MLKNEKNKFKSTFNLHLQNCLDFDFTPFGKVVELKMLKNFCFCPILRKDLENAQNETLLLFHLKNKKKRSSFS
jgi:hypothetical protein